MQPSCKQCFSYIVRPDKSDKSVRWGAKAEGTSDIRAVKRFSIGIPVAELLLLRPEQAFDDKIGKENGNEYMLRS